MNHRRSKGARGRCRLRDALTGLALAAVGLGNGWCEEYDLRPPPFEMPPPPPNAAVDPLEDIGFEEVILGGPWWKRPKAVLEGERAEGGAGPTKVSLDLRATTDGRFCVDGARDGEGAPLPGVAPDGVSVQPRGSPPVDVPGALGPYDFDFRGVPPSDDQRDPVRGWLPRGAGAADVQTKAGGRPAVSFSICPPETPRALGLRTSGSDFDDADVGTFAVSFGWKGLTVGDWVLLDRDPPGDEFERAWRRTSRELGLPPGDPTGAYPMLFRDAERIAVGVADDAFRISLRPVWKVPDVLGHAGVAELRAHLDDAVGRTAERCPPSESGVRAATTDLSMGAVDRALRGDRAQPLGGGLDCVEIEQDPEVYRWLEQSVQALADRGIVSDGAVAGGADGPTVARTQHMGSGDFDLRIGGAYPVADVGPLADIDPVADPLALGGPSGRGSDPDAPEVLIESRGGSTGPVLDLYAVNGREPVRLRGAGLVLEPVRIDRLDDATRRRIDEIRSAAEAAQSTARRSSGAGPAPAPGWERAAVQVLTLDAYCLQSARAVPDEGAIFRIADRRTQLVHAPMRAIVLAARTLQEEDRLHPDTDPDAYFHSARQWSVWVAERGLGRAAFEEAFVEHTRRNLEARGQRLAPEDEEVVRRLVPNRWADVTTILAEARRRMGSP